MSMETEFSIITLTDNVVSGQKGEWFLHYVQPLVLLYS